MTYPIAWKIAPAKKTLFFAPTRGVPRFCANCAQLMATRPRG